MTIESNKITRSGLLVRAAEFVGAYGRSLERRSHAIAAFFFHRCPAVAIAWLAIFGGAALVRLVTAIVPVHGWSDALPIVLPYVLIALAPIAGYMLAAGSFPSGLRTAQPSIRLSLYGRWRDLDLVEARRSPVFGPAGFMASMLIGLMLNVVIRSFEFLAAVPALNGHAPEWGQTMFLVMAADVVVMNFFYMVCFVMALRSVPLFPRMLLFVWGLDILAQLLIAQQVAAIPGLPQMVSGPLHTLLDGNITKVLISAFVWLPYLILSDRVNVTYRRRVRVPGPIAQGLATPA